MLKQFQNECPDCGSDDHIRTNPCTRHYRCNDCGREWDTVLMEMIDLPELHEIKTKEYDRIYAQVIKQERMKNA